jgi:predicted RecA/RadA family phage recombinase
MATLFATQATYVSGEQVPIDYTSSGVLAVGQVVYAVDFIGIVLRPCTASGQLTSLATRGRWKMDKVTEQVQAFGDTVYWDANGVPARDAESTAGALSTNPEVIISAGGAVAGIVAVAAALDDETVTIDLGSPAVPGDLA